MGLKNSLVFAGIAPHPPIMVPEVGLDSIANVQGSIEAMAELTRRVLASSAQTVILISPHAPLDPHAFVAYQDPLLKGDFSAFRVATIVVEAELDDQLLEAITNSGKSAGYEVKRIKNRKLDHGVSVPLYFLQHYGWQGKVVALGFSFLGDEAHLSFGTCIKQATDHLGYPVALIASGDLSHRLLPAAPAGYDQMAHLFDEEVIDALRGNDPGRVVRIDPQLRRRAGECGYRSMLVAIGATKELPPECDVVHYEAPFGVGYLVAQLSASFPASSP